MMHIGRRPSVLEGEPFFANTLLLRLINRLFGNQPTPKITTVINYCSNDYRFIRDCVQNAAAFSEEVLVPYSDHFYDGTPENKALLAQTITENPEASFIFFPYNPDLQVNAQHWVTWARVVGWQNSHPSTTHLLFLDADEIVEANRFAQWLKSGQFQQNNVLKLANYYYFREPCYQALTYEDSAILILKSCLNESMLMDFEDRHKPWLETPEPKTRMVLGLDGLPMVHHYSWVRTKAQMLKKVQTWGHNQDRNWVKLVENEFERDFSGTDFVHGYQYKTVVPYINPH